ncbi:MAG: dihydropteroate synthase [Acidimicrobiia bacterium]
MNVTTSPITWSLRSRSLTNADHTLVMGVVNATPDSFSDGGQWAEPHAAIRRGFKLWDDGADLVDVGGESTRPGAEPVGVEEELARVVPVVEALASHGIIVSIDTSKVEVAAAAVAAGAEIVNDVNGLSDPDMAVLCEETGVGVVIMHMQGDPRSMQANPTYDNVVADVARFLRDRTAAAIESGIDASRIVVDPGIGFGKTFDHNLALLAGTSGLGSGQPVLIGASRKSFLGTILERAGRPSEPADRDTATAATVALAVAAGAAVVRVHDAAGAVDAARTADAIVRNHE